jgi:antitoxin MazE
MKTAVKKWGNSAAVRIPASALAEARLVLDDEVDVRHESGRIVIEPIRRKEYRLEDLLAAITAKNQHQEVDFGSAIGKEAW